MAYPWLKFVYNWADSEWVYVEIDDTKGNYFWPSYFEVDTSFEWHYWYETVPNTEWDVWNADYTFRDFFKDIYIFDISDSKDLKKTFLTCFENHLVDTLFNVSKSFHSSYIWDDYEKIAWFKKCLKSAKEDIDLDDLIEAWSSRVLSYIKHDLELYYEYRDYKYHNSKEIPEEVALYLKDSIKDISWYRDFNKVKYKNFNIRNYIESKRYENLNDVFDFIVNWEWYFN